MLDLAFIRENHDKIHQGLVDLGSEDVLPILDRVLGLDVRRRELLVQVEELRHERNVTSENIGYMENQEQRQKLIEEMRGVGEKIDELEEQLQPVEEELDELMLQMPNMPDPDVPVGPDETHNIVVSQEGEKRSFEFEPVPHWDLGPTLGIIDFERGVKLSGTRFYTLNGLGAQLQRALITWMLDIHTREHGYREIYPPFVVRRDCLVGAAQLPKFKDNLYHDVEDDMWLIPTAEVPLTNLHRDEILDAEDLPLYYVAYTPCFRRERMSAGRDTRGIKRGHQFDKVEMYKIVLPERSEEELQGLMQDAEEVCRRLEIPHRVVQMCTGDLGFQAAKKYDIEMWAPGAEEWLEVSSCSNCRDFQARRANVRFRRERGASPEFVHTLNGSGLALPRVMIAVIENYQQADGSILVPEVLRPYMGGVEVIREAYPLDQRI
ncbi:MAG: serine--tRNA ligase [Chloroflexota bacterium]|nr:serine--tRNA ligase [Chloroflexota bacterium]